MRTQNTIKILLLAFIAYAVYAGHKKFFNDMPDRLANIIPNQPQVKADNDPIENKSVQAEDTKPSNITSKDDKTLDLKFLPKEEDSLMQQWFSSGLNKFLENPQGKAIFKEVVQKMFARQVNMQWSHISRYVDDKVGEGIEAGCADTVEILYNIRSEDSASQNQSQEYNTTKITLGSNTLPSGLENSIIGMREGGTRAIVYSNLKPIEGLPNNQSELGTEENLVAKVTLQSVKQKSKAKNILGRALFNKPSSASASIPGLICGDAVSGSYSIAKLDGKIVYDSTNNNSPISFKIGDGEYPPEISEAIMGLPMNGAEVFFITTLDTVKTIFHKNKNALPLAVRSSVINYPVLLKFNLHNQKLSVAPKPQPDS